MNDDFDMEQWFEDNDIPEHHREYYYYDEYGDYVAFVPPDETDEFWDEYSESLGFDFEDV